MARYRLRDGDSFEPTPEPDQPTRAVRRALSQPIKAPTGPAKTPPRPSSTEQQDRYIDTHRADLDIRGRPDLLTTGDRARALRGDNDRHMSKRLPAPIDLTGELDERQHTSRQASAPSSQPQFEQHECTATKTTATTKTVSAPADPKPCTCLPCIRQLNSFPTITDPPAVSASPSPPVESVTDWAIQCIALDIPGQMMRVDGRASRSTSRENAREAQETDATFDKALQTVEKSLADDQGEFDDEEEWYPQPSDNGDAEKMNSFTVGDLPDESFGHAGDILSVLLPSDFLSSSSAQSEQLHDRLSASVSICSAEPDDNATNSDSESNSDMSESCNSQEGPPSGCELSDHPHREGSDIDGSDNDALFAHGFFTDAFSTELTDADEERSIKMGSDRSHSETASFDESDSSSQTDSDEHDSDGNGSSASEALFLSAGKIPPASRHQRGSPSPTLQNLQCGHSSLPGTPQQDYKLDLGPRVPPSYQNGYYRCFEEPLISPFVRKSHQERLPVPESRLKNKAADVLMKADKAGASLRARLDCNSDLDDSVGNLTEDEMTKLAAAYDEPSPATVSPLTSSTCATTTVDDPVGSHATFKAGLPKRAPSPSLSQLGEEAGTGTYGEGSPEESAINTQTSWELIQSSDFMGLGRLTSNAEAEADEANSHCPVSSTAAHSASDAHSPSNAAVSRDADKIEQAVHQAEPRTSQDLQLAAAAEGLMNVPISGKRKRDDDAEAHRSNDLPIGHSHQRPVKRMRPVSLVALGFGAGFVAGSASLFAGLSWLGGE